jgi:hypothetical protein
VMQKGVMIQRQIEGEAQLIGEGTLGISAHGTPPERPGLDAGQDPGVEQGSGTGKTGRSSGPLSGPLGGSPNPRS